MNSVERVKSICRERKIPISKVERDLGYANGYIGQLKKGTFPADRMQDIAQYLEVSIEYLLTGKEEVEKDQKDIREILANTEQLLKQDGLMLDGDPASPEAIESILSAIQIGMEMAKKKNRRF